MRKAGDLLRERADAIAPVLTREQGKPLAEAKGEVVSGADILDWFAEEARRTYGRMIPARSDGGAADRDQGAGRPGRRVHAVEFSHQPGGAQGGGGAGGRLLGHPQGAGGDAGRCAALVQALADAGLPAGVLNLVFGVPAEISGYLIPHPTIRKVSFTGSMPVGKHLAALAGAHMKRVTMELGGHSPAIVFADADVDVAAKILSANKFRNAGQVCVSPTRFIVHEAALRAVRRTLRRRRQGREGRRRHDGRRRHGAAGDRAPGRGHGRLHRRRGRQGRQGRDRRTRASAIPAISSSPPCSPTCRSTPA